MKHSNNETLMIAWCDNGLVDGKFANGLLTSAFSSGVPVNYITRIHGNQIARQRQEVFNHWADEIKTDWLFWIDSDIVVQKYEALIDLGTCRQKQQTNRHWCLFSW